MTQTVDQVWDDISEAVYANIKIAFLETHAAEILRAFSTKIDRVVGRYTRFLPSYVASSEVDDLKTIAQLEFIETLKIWDPEKGKDVWPIAYSRITGAMKDHIRYITKSDPSRFYDWINDAASVYLAVSQMADFEKQIETGDELRRAMEGLSPREQKIVNMYVKKDLTFQQIGDELGISESQISRIYKKAVEKIKKHILASE